MEAIARDPSVMGTPVEKVMGPKLPTIGVGQKVERAVKMLETAPALLVLSGGRPLRRLTRTDILSYFEAVADDVEGRSPMGEREDAAGLRVRDPRRPRRPGARPGDRRGRHRRSRWRRRSPRTASAGTRASSTRGPGNPTRTALEDVRRLARGGPPRARLRQRPRRRGQRAAAASRRAAGSLLGNDAYGGTFRLIAKVWAPLGHAVDGGRPHRRRRARRRAGRTTRRWCGWRPRPTRC